MRNIIAGTAGHIDHGKTALVRALTGIDTDRLAEEKRRGISIDLGFAHLDLDKNIRLGLVDVPGHERFIKNMLAGAGGMDLVLFIIAADESIKPQTREHFEICRLLRIPAGIVVLTKCDLVDRDILDLVRLEVDDFLRGTFLESAPVIPVSSVTGQGLPELKAAISALASKIAARDAASWFRMPVDRTFTMRGFGTVATGTLLSGSVALEDEIQIYPAARVARVRGLQVHGQSVERATAGQRTAVNLAGIDIADVSRGMTLGPKGRFHSASVVDTFFELLPDAHPLRHSAPVHFHAGTAAVEAQARLLESTRPMAPGSSACVRFLLREPLLILPGDCFIVRMFSPVVTIGGGEVVDIDPPLRLRRAAAAERVRQLHAASPEARVALLVDEVPSGISVQSLIARTGLSERYIQSPTGWLVAPRFLEGSARAVHSALEAFHKQNPLSPGMQKEDLRASVPLLDHVLGGMKTVAVEGEMVRLVSHKVALKQDEEAALAKIESAFASAGLAVPALNDVLGNSGLEASRARALLQILLRARKLIKVSDNLVFHAAALAQLKQTLASRKGQRFTVPEFKDWTGISRKYAIPLLEYLDRERVTRRDGDARVVL